MASVRVLQLSAIAFIVLTGMTVALVFWDMETLPEELLLWSESQEISWVPIIIGGMALLGTLVGSVALLVHKKWGGWVHLLSMGACLVAGLALGPSVASALSSFVASLWLLTAGFIYGLVFYTDVFAGDQNESGPKPEPRER